jgi:plasmid stabilization system protein ParE
MESKPVRLHPEAEQEYLAALTWYRDRSPITAEEFATVVREAIAKIREAPRRWPFYDDNFRKYTLRQFPFSILYQELLSEITVFAIAHGFRRPGYWRARV